MPITSTKRKLNKNENLVVAILGATKAPRMGNFGAKLNIVMPDNQTLLHHQINFVQKQWSPTEIYVSVGYDADRVIAKRPPGIRFIENNKWDETGEVEELRLILNCCNPDKLVIVCGDIYVSGVIIPSTTDSFSLSLTNQDDLNQIGTKNENEFLNMFSFAFPTKFLGLIQLCGNELIYIRKLINRERSKFALWELLDDYVKQGYKLKGIELNTHKVIKIATAKDLGIIRNSAGILV
jgi:hypothetical protein